MSIHLSTAMLAHLFSYDMYVSLHACLTSRSWLKWKSFSKDVGFDRKRSRTFLVLDWRWVFLMLVLAFWQVLLTYGGRFDLISPSYLATLQIVLHHLLRSYCHDDYFYYECHTFWVADSRMELGFDHSPFTCGGMSYSFTGKSDYFISKRFFLVKERTIH